MRHNKEDVHNVFFQKILVFLNLIKKTINLVGVFPPTL